MYYNSHCSTRSDGSAPKTERVSSQPPIQRRNLVYFILLTVVTISNFSFAQINPDVMVSSTKEIKAAIQQNGSVRVLVGLTVDFKPEGELATSQDIADQQLKISMAQKQLISDIKDILPLLEEKIFTTIPYLAVNVNQEVLNLLMTHSLVKTIQLDEVNSLSVPNNNMEVIQ